MSEASRQHQVPEELRGTYAGLAHPAVIDYLCSLGVTAVELMPIHHFIADRHLLDKGLTNFWGYNTIGFFAPHAPYSSSGIHGQQVIEFKEMVKTLHRAGIEVILDVVYNHTAEGHQMGPTLSRGIVLPITAWIETGAIIWIRRYGSTLNRLANVLRP
jgi:glycogen operon protein